MLKYIKKYVDISKEDENKFLKTITKANKATIKKNFETITKMGLTEKHIALLLANYPEIFLLDPNPENNSSITAKADFYSRFDIEPKFVVMLYTDLLLTDIYPSSNEVAVLNYLENELYLDRKSIGKILRKSNTFLKYKIKDNSYKGFIPRINFWKQVASDARVDFNKFIVRHCGLLSASINPQEINSVAYKMDYLKKRFNLAGQDLADQVYSFPNFLGLDFDPNKNGNIELKIKKLNELGFSDEVIGKNLKALGAPLKKLKIRYMIVKNFNMLDSTFLNRKYMIHEAKLYARACYIRQHKLRNSLIYETESIFKRDAGITIEELVKLYPLTKEIAKEQEDLYNKEYGKNLHLTEDELKEIDPTKYIGKLERGA